MSEVVLTGGWVFDGRAPLRADVAVGGGRIVAVEADLTRIQTRGAEVIETGGGLIVAGFQDAHAHPVWGGLDRRRCDLHGLPGRSAYLEAIAAYAAAHPEREWILGAGWSMPEFPGGTPTRRDLDEVVADRPVFLKNRDGHGAWVNGKALDLAGVTAATPDPPDGRIERDPVTGEPVGTLHEGAMDLVERRVPPPSPVDLEEALLDAQRYLHSLGITAWQDAWTTPDVLGAYRRLTGRNLLTARVRAALWWERAVGVDQVEDLVERRAAAAGDGVEAGAVKIMQDGVAENFTAAMLDPYLDGEGAPTTNRGIGFLTPEELRGAVRELDRHGFQVHVHAIGDRAVREALDAFESARATNGPSTRRHHIAHLQVVHPADRSRFAALDVAANMQPHWACAEPQMVDLTIPFLGRERAGWQYPFADLARSGARLAIGSDWPVSPCNPLEVMEVATTRVRPEHREARPFLPEQRLDLATVLTAYTAGSAYVNHLDTTGRVAVGMDADLAVIDRNLFDPGAGPIADAGVVLTMVGGEVVHER